ncbi:hypothetical protein FRB94_012636 [Tulasnella sp. JGI-2019a]|nr:hypothetical protein FRB93_001539 [Tulasnella sp. JGI-2019a]KAG9008999.1 hypothetical protein FRB94_012636 [Tulasnella sp. JGI-2019a]
MDADSFLEGIARSGDTDRYKSSSKDDSRYERGHRSSRYDDDRHHRDSYRGGGDRDRGGRDDHYRRDDRRDSRGGRRDYDDRDRRPSGRYDDDRRGGRDEYRGGGGRGGGSRGDYDDRDRGRGRGRDAPSAERRSPTPVDAVPLSQRKRKASGWDVKPPGYEHLTAQQAKATGLFNLPGANRSQPAPSVIGVPPVQFPSFGSFPPPGAPGVTGAPNLARQSRRLYVGNITYEANEENLHTFFSAKMTEMGFSTSGPGDPVLAVQVNHEKSYAFVEFRNAEDATAAMAFDGIIFQSGPLKIRRPKDYAGSDAAPSGVHVPGVVSTIVPDSVNKIFVGGLPTYLNDEQVMELLKSFGELKAFNLVKDSSTGLSKGFAFFEYVDPNVTDLATQGLNGMELGDRYLVVQRASIGAKGISSTPGMPSAEEYSAAMGVGIGGMGARPIVPAQVDLSNAAESRILLMLNMVTPEDLVDDTEYNEILEDIRAECANFGQVDDIRIPRPPKKEKTGWVPGGAKEKNEMQAEGVGRVYIKYHEPAGAQMGLKALAGRSFAGRSIIATLLGDEANSVFEPSELVPMETADV